MEYSIVTNIILNTIVMKLDYIIAVLLGIVGCVIYYFRILINRKLEDYIVLFLTSIGVIGGLKTAWIAVFGIELKNISSEIRFFIFIGGSIIFLVSIYMGTKILNIPLNLF